VEHETESLKPGRKRKKFIRKVSCEVCGDVANDHIHYGARTCYSCRAFFRRSVTSGTKYKCAQAGDCEITKATRRQCQACRIAKCHKVGMLPSWVMTEEEKVEKKVAAETKKKLKVQASTSNTKHVDLSVLPQSSYLKKRAEFRQKRRCKDKQKIPASENESLHSEDEFVEDSPRNDFEIKSEVESNDECESPERLRRRDESGESTSSMVMQPLELSNRSSTVTSIPSELMYSKDDEHLVSLLVNLENHSRDEVPMSPLVKMGIMDSLKSGLPFPYKVSLEGYTTAVQRLAHFISKIDAFNAINLEDRRSLIGNNCHMVVNIKSARILNPQNNLNEQMRIAKLDMNGVQETTAIVQQPTTRLEYNQIFQSPWCCDADDELDYKEMMESIIKLNMDEVENTLMTCAAMFDVSEFKTYGSEESKELYTVGLEYYDSMLGIPTKKRNPSCNGMISSPLKTKMTNRVIKDKELVLSFQQFYVNLLQRYLISKHGENASIERHHDVLVKLKEMREILIRKSLQF